VLLLECLAGILIGVIMKKNFIIGFLFSLIFSPYPIPSVFAMHPLVTDDTGTQGRGNIQFELNGEYGNEKEDGITGNLYELSTILTYGIIDSIDIVFGIPYQQIEIKESETVRESGLSDAGFEIKWKFLEINNFGLAFKPGMSFPTGDDEKGLGTGEYGYSAFFISTNDFNPVIIHINLGYLRNENKANEIEDVWHASIAGEFGAFENLRFVANTGVENNTDKECRINPAFVLAGLVYSPAEYIDLDIGFKYGLNSPETDYTVLGGLTLRF